MTTKKIFLWVTAVLVLAALAGCETVQGVGRDITNLGSTTERAFSHRGGGGDR